MLKKNLRKAAVLSSALLLAAAFATGCGNELDVLSAPEGLTESSRAVFSDDCSTMPKYRESKTLTASEEDGTWISAWSDYKGAYHVQEADQSATGGGSYKFQFAPERWDARLFMRFTDADPSSKFECTLYGRKNSSDQDETSLEYVNVLTDNGGFVSEIFSTETKISKDYHSYTPVKTSALGVSSGWLEFKFNINSETTGYDAVYFDNITYSKKSNEKLLKVYTAESTEWEQTGKFQFMINKPVKKGDTVSFKYRPCSDCKTLTLRGVSTSTKWIDSAAIQDKAGWNSVYFTTQTDESAVGVTVYVSSKSTGQVVYIKDFTVNGTRFEDLTAGPYSASPAVINSKLVSKVESGNGGGSSGSSKVKFTSLELKDAEEL
ncbi:MAG: hypothetical protein J6Y93_06200, partial [Treponema sp.]|nr:hypothetical protein [Treponema sp.]